MRTFELLLVAANFLPFVVFVVPRFRCTGYLDHPFKNKPFETEKNLLGLLANTGWLV